MRTSILDLLKMKQSGTPIPVLTCYDYTSARILDSVGIPVLLVGDSLGMVVHGFDSTLPVTLEMMICHCQAVARGAKNALIVIDLPFATYSFSDYANTLKNAARGLAEGGAQAVKIEGGARMAPVVASLIASGIPVMGHIGLTPQSINQLGGYKMQGKDENSRKRLLADALELEAAGAFAIVLELVPHDLAKHISERLKIPTIGIGAGRDCDGQVQVFHDVFGLYEDFVPKHTRRYTQVADAIRGAAKAYIGDVTAKKFPEK
ncbi:MAG TPA: 3-methyl-2-oxobutanoate hydroxymethyltransferase [Planctomycetota bacterium]|nr:3-methyl-2-oxobutanoate hydroxymethyltransferase [Planctomycetota bacterium]